MIRSHPPVPEQAAPQPAKVEFAVGPAVRETSVPGSNGAEQTTSGQRKLPNETVPETVPASVRLGIGNGCVVLSITLTVLPNPFVMIRSGKPSPLRSAATIDVALAGPELK